MALAYMLLPPPYCQQILSLVFRQPTKRDVHGGQHAQVHGTMAPWHHDTQNSIRTELVHYLGPFRTSWPVMIF